MEPFEPPKYLASLIAAINDGAKSAQLGALAFTVVGLFLLATAFSATDEDLLLNHAIGISQLGGAQVPVVFAFGLAPTVFVAAHLYTLIRYDMLASGVRQFLADLRAMVPLEADRERCRQLLANVEFINALAMPPGSRASSWLFRWTSVVLIAVFPVTVLLLVQISSLRLQVVVVNWIHHTCLVIDLVLLVWFFGRQSGDGDWSFWSATMRRKAALCWLPAAVMAMDLAWLRVPDAESTTVPTDILGYAGANQRGWDEKPLLDRWTRVLLAIPVQPVDLVLCKHVGWGCRFLTVTNRPLVTKVWQPAAFVELRAGKDATGDRMAGIEPAKIDGRSLLFADLHGSGLFGADLFQAQLQRADLFGTQLRGAILNGAQLQGANLSAAQLQGAFMSGAQLQGANLTGAAQLQGAYLSGAQLQGANLNSAQLQGADLSGAQLQGADLRQAQLQGADLRNTGLWNIKGDGDTEIGLGDLRAADFGNTLENPEERAKLLAGVPEAARQRVETALTPRVGARTLPRIGTRDGPVLVDSSDTPAFRSLQPEQTTTNVALYDNQLAAFLAGKVAPIAPEVAAGMAARVWGSTFLEPTRTLASDLACRLILAADQGAVQLKPDTVKHLQDRVGAGCSPPAKP